MKSVGVYEARTRFSALVRDAEKGETIQLTRNGEVVAELGPPSCRREAHRAAESLLARNHTFGGSIAAAMQAARERQYP